MKIRALYFGCWRGPGHFFWLPNGEKQHFEVMRQEIIPFKLIDGKMAKTTRGKGHADPVELQPQGAGMLHYKGGWTGLAFWDRSIDHRHGSNSVFFFEGIHDFDTVLVLAEQEFPQIMDRFEFDIHLHDTVTYNGDGTRVTE